MFVHPELVGLVDREVVDRAVVLSAMQTGNLGHSVGWEPSGPCCVSHGEGGEGREGDSMC